MSGRPISKAGLAVALLGTLLLAPAASAEMTVVPVPYAADNAAIPHPAYNGRTVTLKAVVRDAPGTARFRWDADGDGDWDTSPDLSWPANPQTTSYTVRLGGRDIGFRTAPPAVTRTRVFIAVVEVSADGTFTDTVRRATYPYVVYSEVPASGATVLGKHVATHPELANEEQLQVMRDVAVDDALWYAHVRLGPTGTTGGEIGGMYDDTGFGDTDANMLMLFTAAGRRPAYPPGTYSGAAPEGFLAANDARWATDPYAEDAVRLVNRLLSRLGPVTLDPLAEADDGTTPIAGTNDGIGLTSVSSMNARDGDVAAALAAAGLDGTVAQTGAARGRPLEFVQQQMIDWVAFRQLSSGWGYGGWTYGAPSADAAIFVTEGIARGVYRALAAAQASPSGVHVPVRTLERFASFLESNPGTDGLPRSYNQSTELMLASGDAILGMAGVLGADRFAASDPTAYGTLTRGRLRTRFDGYVSGLSTWAWTRGFNAIGWWDGLIFNADQMRTDDAASVDAMSSIAAGIAAAAPANRPPLLGSRDWRRMFSTYLVRNQRVDGSWMASPPYPSIDYYNPQSLETAQAAQTLSLTRTIAPRPVAIASTSPTSVGCATRVTVDASDSFHPGAGRSIAAYEWDFTDDGAFTVQETGATVTRTLGGLAPTVVTLRVRDDADPPQEDRQSVALGYANTAPVVSAGGPYVSGRPRGGAMRPLDLAATATDPDGECDGIVAQAWDTDGDGLFGSEDTDGAGATVGGVAVEGRDLEGPAVEGFVGAGWLPGTTDTVRFRATDRAGGSTVGTATVRIANTPVAAVSGPYAVDEGATVAVTGTAADADGDALSTAWDLDALAGFERAGGLEATFDAAAFDGPAAVPIRLRAVDPDGFADEATGTVTVRNVAPSVDAGADRAGRTGSAIAFSGAFTDPARADTHTIVWDFGDDRSATGAVSASHVYTEIGAFIARLTVTDDDGGRDVDEVLVAVAAAPGGGTPPPGPGPAPTGEVRSTAPAPDRTAPSVAIGGPRLSVSRKGVVAVRVAVSEPVSGTVALRLRSGRRTLAAGSAKLTMSRAGTATVRVTLSRAARAALRKVSSPKLTVVVRAADPAGNRASAQRALPARVGR